MRVRYRITVMTLALGVTTALTTPIVLTHAHWQQREWAHGAVSTLDCSVAGGVPSRAAGRLLSGGLLPTDLDAVAAVRGMTVTHDGSSAHPVPATAGNPGGGDAYADPLDVSLLSAVDLPLTGTSLADVLTIPLDSDVGALNQYARASGDGTSTGAAGLVNDAGAIDTYGDPGTGAPPMLGTLQLSTLVSELTGQAASDLVAGLTDLTLEVGAVAGRADLDGCAAAWDGDPDQHLTRDYAVAGLDAHIDSPTVSGLVTTTESAVGEIETVVNELASDQGLVDDLAGKVSDVLDGLLGRLRLGGTTVTGPSVTVDLSAVEALLTDDVSDEAGVVRINLDGGTIDIDLAALLGEAYGGHGFHGQQDRGLNGLPANTELVLNDAVINALIDAMGQALDDWVADVVAAVEQALYAATVDLTLDLQLSLLVPVAQVEVSIADIQLDSLLGTPGHPPADIGVSTRLLGLGIGDVLLDPIVEALTTGIGPAVGQVLEGALLGEGSVVSTLGDTLSTATAPVVDLLGNVLTEYLGTDGVASLKANVQNDAAVGSTTDPAAPSYADWESGQLALPPGRYDVAALAIGVLDVADPNRNLNLELGRGSVGANG